MLLLLACAPAPTLTLGEVRSVVPTRAVAGTWARDFGKDPGADLGPLAVLADDDGFALLDQENRRILRYDADGEARGEVPVASRATLDAARDGAGFATLEYDRETVTWSSRRPDGAPLATGLRNPTAIFVDGDTVLVEDAHGETVDPAGNRYPGRPTGDGRYVRAVKDGDDVVLTWSDGKVVRVEPGRMLGNVVALDARDDVVLLSMLLFDESATFEMVSPELRTVVLDDAGTRRDEVSIPPGVATTVARELALGPDGALWRLTTDADGVGVERWELRP
jgi:hypothetical protein